MIGDAYPHVCPERLMDSIGERRPGAEVAVLRRSGCLFDGGRRLRCMDRIGADQQVLAPVRPPMWPGMPRPVTHELTRAANDSIAEMAAKWLALISPKVEGLPLDDPSMRPLYEEAARGADLDPRSARPFLPLAEGLAGGGAGHDRLPRSGRCRPRFRARRQPAPHHAAVTGR